MKIMQSKANNILICDLLCSGDDCKDVMLFELADKDGRISKFMQSDPNVKVNKIKLLYDDILILSQTVQLAFFLIEG